MSAHKFYSAIRIVTFGFKNLFRNLWLTIAATAVMFVALTIIMLGLVLNVTTSNAIDVLSKELRSTIILESGSTRQQAEALMAEIDAQQYVATVQYITPAEAQKRLTDDPSIGNDVLQATALFEEDFLAPSIEVGMTDLSRAKELAAIAEKEDYKELVNRVALGKTDTGAQTDAEKAIDRAAATEKYITIGSIIAASTLSAVSIMIIFNTIRMAIYTRRDEIAIMKLIGATPNYIRGPFLVEASLYGIIAGILATASLYSLIFTLGSKVADTPEFTQSYNYFTSVPMIVLMTMGALMVGTLIGVVSSMLAMERHLKLKHW